LSFVQSCFDWFKIRHKDRKRKKIDSRSKKVVAFEFRIGRKGRYEEEDGIGMQK
jgi:hypothetical protein